MDEFKKRPCPECENQESITWSEDGHHFRTLPSPLELAEIQVIETDLWFECAKCFRSGAIAELRILWWPCPNLSCFESDMDRVHWDGYRTVMVNKPRPGALLGDLHVVISMRWQCDTCLKEGRERLNTDLLR